LRSSLLDTSGASRFRYCGSPRNEATPGSALYLFFPSGMDDIDLEPVFGDVIQAIPQVGEFQSRQIRGGSLDELDLSWIVSIRCISEQDQNRRSSSLSSISSTAFSIPLLLDESDDSGSSPSSIPRVAASSGNEVLTAALHVLIRLQ